MFRNTFGDSGEVRNVEGRNLHVWFGQGRSGTFYVPNLKLYTIDGHSHPYRIGRGPQGA